MASRKKNSRLDDYGYRDQNAFDSNICDCKKEITSVKRVNNFQELEIHQLISGKVDSDIASAMSATIFSALTDMQEEIDGSLSALTGILELLQDEIDTRSDEVQYLSGAIDSNTAAIEVLNEELNNSTSGLSAIVSSLSASVFNSVDGLSGKVETLSAKTDCLSGMVSSLSASIFSTVDGLSGKVDTLSGSIFSTVDGLSGKVDTLSGVIFSTVDGLSGKVDTLSADVKSLSAKTEMLDKELNDSISGLSGVIITNSNAISALSSVTSDLVVSAVTFSGNIKDLQDYDEDLNERLTSLSSNAWREITKNRQNITKNTEKITELSGKVITFSGSVETSAKTLDNKIDKVEQELINSAQTLSNAIKGWEDDLNKEIQDRKDGDDDILDELHTTYITSAQSVADDNTVKKWVEDQKYITIVQSEQDDQDIIDWVKGSYITTLSAQTLVEDALNEAKTFATNGDNAIISAYTKADHDLSDKVTKNTSDIVSVSGIAETTHNELADITDSTTQTGKLFDAMNTSGLPTIKVEGGHLLVYNGTKGQYYDLNDQKFV